MSNPARPLPKMTIDEYFKKYGVFSDLVSTNILTFDELYKSYYDQFRTLIYEIVQIDGLEETPTVDETFLKYCIFITGKATFFKTKSGELRALNGTYSGVPDIYYIPELMIVTNPRLEDSYELKRGEDCEVVYCREVDRYNLAPFGGLFPLISETATIIADNKISINVAQKNTRLINLITADTETAKRSAETVIANMYAGLPFGVIMSNLVDELRSVPLIPNTTNRYLIDLIQLEQYALSHFFEKIGLYTHDQMKKERLITAEVNDNANLPIFNIYNIIKTMNKGFEKVNEHFGTHYHAYLNPLIVNQIENIQEREEVEAETEGAEIDGKSEPETATLGDSSEAEQPDNEKSVSESSESESDNSDESEDRRGSDPERSDIQDDGEPDEAEQSETSEDSEDDAAASTEPEGSEPEEEAGTDDEEDPTPIEINLNTGDISGDPEINIDVKVGDTDESEELSEEMDGDRRGSSDESVDAVRGSSDSDRSESE